MSHAHSDEQYRRWHDEPLQLTEDLNGAAEAGKVRDAIRGNVELLSGLRPVRAPAGLWERIAAQLDQPMAAAPTRMPRRVARLWWVGGAAAALAAGVVLAVSAALDGGAGGMSVAPETPIAARWELSPVAASVPGPEQLLARMEAATRGQAFRGTAVIEQLTPDEVRLPPRPREAQVSYAAFDRWRIESGGGVYLRNGEVRARTGDLPGGPWNPVRSDELGRSPVDDLTAEPAVLARNYKLASAPGEAKAGRPTWLLTAESRHPVRPSLKMWLDRETGVRLAWEKRDTRNRAVARMSFRDFAPVAGFGRADLFEVPVRNRDLPDPHHEFQPRTDAARLQFRRLIPEGLPAGFELRRTILQSNAAAGRASLRMILSDGLAAVDVYQRPVQGAGDRSAQQYGSSLELTDVCHGVQVRAVSEDVDLATLSAIVKSLTPAAGGGEE